LSIGEMAPRQHLVISNGGSVISSTARLGDWGSSNSVLVTDGGVWRCMILHLSERGSITGPWPVGDNSLVVGGGSVFATNLTVGFASATCDNFVQLDSGSVMVTNAAANATLEVRYGQFILNGGLLQVDKLVITNSCARFIRNGGTLIYGSLLLDATMDADGDGMLNGWEQLYGLDPLNAADGNVDSDGDGFANLQEFQAGTDPNNSASAFRITNIAQEDNDVRVAWRMGSNRTNALQAAAGDGGLYTNQFADIFTVTNTVGTETNYLDAGAATNTPARFYRIRLVP
jgi:thrombospondin type 3 repeat protein